MRNQLKNQTLVSYKKLLSADVYRLYDDNGITIDYEVSSGIFTMNGTSTGSVDLNITSTLPMGVYSASSYYISGSIDDGGFNILTSPWGELDIHYNQVNYNTNMATTEGVGEADEYFYYSKDYYTATNNSTLFPSAWQDMKDSETVLFDIPLTLVAPNQEMSGFTIDLYVGTNGQLQELYDACANGTIPPPIDNDTRDVYYVNNVATYYAGDISGDVGFPIPLYNFGSFNSSDDTSFLVGDLTPLSMGLGLVLAKIANVSIPNNNIVIQQGFEFENENGIIIPEGVTSIGAYAFRKWSSNNQPLVIPNSVTSIGDTTFAGWSANNQLLVIPNSVTSIGDLAFQNWSSNNQPLVIPNSVTSIGGSAFRGWSSNNQPLVIPNSVTSIESSAFSGWSSNNQPLIIPNSVTSIGGYAFYNWSSNNQPLIIPDSVTSIAGDAFRNWSLVPYVEIQAITPPTLVNANAFSNQNNAPIYVPDESVEAYKTATNWVALANRIFAVSEKPVSSETPVSIENYVSKYVDDDNQFNISISIYQANASFNQYKFKYQLEQSLEVTDYVVPKPNIGKNLAMPDLTGKPKISGLTERKDSNGYYTGEKVNTYGSIQTIRVVINFQKGKVYNEQFGLMYEYAASLQHTGAKILNEGDLVWLQTDTSNSADYIVKGVVPSLNSTLYHLIKKEA